MPVTQHHPENQDNIIPSVLDSPFHSHNYSIKKSQQVLARKKWHALRESNPQPSDP